MNQSRCLEDEKLFAVIHELNPTGGGVTIFDCRPKMNARANYLASGTDQFDTHTHPFTCIWMCDMMSDTTCYHEHSPYSIHSFICYICDI